MGHLQGRGLPTSKKWTQVVEMLRAQDSTADIARATADAAEKALTKASGDPLLAEALWLLVNLPILAREPDFADRIADFGVKVAEDPSLLDLTASISASLDAQARDRGVRTDLGEMAQMALVESLVHAIEPQLPSLFTPAPEEVRHALGRLAGGNRFGQLARSFFARLTHRCLDYYLSRELANHLGDGHRFATDADRRAFDAALATHCHEAAGIVESFAGGWYGKKVWQENALTRETTGNFARFAFRKVRSELGRRRDAA